MLRQIKLCHDRVWPGKEFFCRSIMFLCRDRVGNGGEALCRDRKFYVTTEYGQMERFCVAIGNIMLRPSWPG